MIVILPLLVAAQITTPPPMPDPADWYLTCVAATTRSEATKSILDEGILVEVEKRCGFIADKVPGRASALRVTGETRAKLISASVRSQRPPATD